MGKNGGKTVRVLKTGAPGSPSTVLVDLELEFDFDFGHLNNIDKAG